MRSTGVYEQWGNTRSDLAFIRRFDVYQEVKKGRDIKYSLHPDPSWPLPNATANGRPGNHWIYQNTFVDMETFAPVLDDLMLKAGILPMHR